MGYKNLLCFFVANGLSLCFWQVLRTIVEAAKVSLKKKLCGRKGKGCAYGPPQEVRIAGSLVLLGLTSNIHLQENKGCLHIILSPYLSLLMLSQENKGM